MLLCAIPIQAEEAVRVQATPQVQAVNLAPIETPATGSPQNIIELKVPKIEDVLKEKQAANSMQV